MRYSLHFMLLLSIILSIYEVLCGCGYSIYIMIAIISITSAFTLNKINKQLIVSDYYGVGQLGWEDSTKKERREYIIAHTASEIRVILTSMLMSENKQQTKIKWMIYKLDQKFE